MLTGNALSSTFCRSDAHRSGHLQGRPVRKLLGHTEGAAETFVGQGATSKERNSGLDCHIVREQF
jgi:hypothetical protein